MPPKTVYQIDARKKSVREVLDKMKYTLDYYQREYSWTEEQIQQFIDDLTSKFLDNFEKKHNRNEVENYQGYFLGPIIVNHNDNRASLVDGQQRLTSLTLLLIYLHRLQLELKEKNSVDDLIFSKRYGSNSFNLDMPERLDCFQSLLKEGSYQLPLDSNENESLRNINAAYENIEKYFPDELKESSLPYFIDWLTERVSFVDISTFSDDDAYTIFETMNDRGLQLSPSDMLKGYILSKSPKDERESLNSIWKRQKEKLAEIVEFEKINNEFEEFFQSFFRAKYALTIRQGKEGAENEDFEKIANRMHVWFRDNEVKSFKLNTANEFSNFIKRNITFYLDVYKTILSGKKKYSEKFDFLYYLEALGIAPSLLYPLLLSPIELTDDDVTIYKKLQMTSKYLETFLVFRGINFKTSSHSSIRYSIYSLVKEIRGKTVAELSQIYAEKVSKMEYNLDETKDFYKNGQNRKFIHFLLARITKYVELNSGASDRFKEYWSDGYDIEHIWQEGYYPLHENDFEDEEDFKLYRNSFGALLILPYAFNRSYQDNPYEDKVEHYFSQNLLAKTLNQKCYENNPGFLRYKQRSGLPFQPYDHFTKESIDDRQDLYELILREIYDERWFEKIAIA